MSANVIRTVAPAQVAFTSAQVEPKLQSLSFIELDAAIDHELVRCNENLIPFLQEMHERLDAQGSRNDLHPDTPAIGWQAWVESKKSALGSLATVKRLLAAPKDPPAKLTPLQNAVVQALVGQGYKKKEAVAMVKAADGEDFEQLFKSALSFRPGGGTATPDFEDEQEQELVDQEEKSGDQSTGESFQESAETTTVPGVEPTSAVVTYRDWESHRPPIPDFKLKYFKEAAGNFTDRFRHAVEGSAFTKVRTMLRDNQQVLAHAHDFENLALVLRGAGDNLDLLAAAITTSLTQPLKPEPASQEDATQCDLPPAEHTDAPEGVTGEPPKQGEDSREGQSTENTQPKEEPALFYKKRVLRTNGQEIIDYPVFKRGGDDVPEDVFDTEADAQTYLAKAIDRKGTA